jgi:hypothetical protein
MSFSPVLPSPSFRLIRRFAGGLAVVAALSAASVASAATLGSDKASNYTSWTNGTNGGTGFGAWDLTGNNGNGTTLFTGYFLGDSTAGSGNINTSGNSFGMYANPNGAFANASRSFVGSLTLGQTFSIQLAVNFRNGDKGLNLLSGATQVFNFDIGQSGTGVDGYYYHAGTAASTSTGFAYFADSVFTLSYTQQSATAGLFTIARTSATGGAAASNSVNVPLTTSGLSSFTLYNSNANNANGDNLYFNNLVVVPEPSAIALMTVGLMGVCFVYRRRMGRLA